RARPRGDDAVDLETIRGTRAVVLEARIAPELGASDRDDQPAEQLVAGGPDDDEAVRRREALVGRGEGMLIADPIHARADAMEDRRRGVCDREDAVLVREVEDARSAPAFALEQRRRDAEGEVEPAHEVRER